MEIIQTAPDNKWKNFTKDISSLSIILILYHFLSQYLSYFFYYICYWIFSGSVTFSWGEVQRYFSDKPELVNSTTFLMTANITISAACVLIALAAARVFFRMTVWNYMKPSVPSTKTAFRWMPSCFVFNMISSTLISMLTRFLSSMGVDVPTADFSIRQPSVLAVIMQFSYIIILAPLFEEIIYRGLILKTISPYSKTAAVLVSALSFGMMHGNIPQAASAFCTGVVYAIIALKCGSIIPTIIIHGLNNLLVNSPELAGALGIPNNEAVISTIEIIVALFGFFIWFTQYRFMKFDDASKAEKTEGIRKTLTSPMMIVYFAILFIAIIRRIINANS